MRREDGSKEAWTDAVLAEKDEPGKTGATEAAMNEDNFNMEVRKYLKLVGVTSQREIEAAVRAAAAGGTLKPGAKLKAKMRLTIAEIGLSHEIDGEIAVD
jgi:hypothetical protein